MIFDKHPEIGSKWDRSFGARGYYVSTVGNITEETIKRYIQEQQEDSKQEEKRKQSLFKRQMVVMLADTRLLGELVISPYRANSKPPLEVVVADLVML